MRLKELRIRNFRSYSDEFISEIKFGTGINTIVGKNNVGKSAIVQSLMYLKNEIENNPYDKFAERDNVETMVEIITELSPSEVNMLITPLLSGVSNTEEILKFQKDRFPNVTYTRNGFFEIRIGGYPTENNRIFSKSYNRNNQAKRNIKNWEPDVAINLKKVGIIEILDDIFLHGAEREEENIFITINVNLYSILLEFLHKIKIFPEFRRRPAGSDQVQLESFDGSYVASVLNTLKNGDSKQIRKWRKIKDNFTEFYPSLILDVRRIPQQNPQVWIENKDIDYDVSVDKVGAGISEFIVFLTHIIDSKDYIFCLDSSEIHFHPHAQRKLLNLIKKYSRNNQFVLVTHSPNLIKSTKLSNIAIIRRNQGYSTIHQVSNKYFTSNELRKLNRIMTHQFLELFFSDVVFFVEGSTETGAMPIFAQYLEKSFDANNISIIETGKYFEIPIKLCLGFELPYMAMCDKDALMNIENHYGSGRNRRECSPVVQTLLRLRLLNKAHKDIIYNPNNITEKGNKKKYSNNLYKPLKDMAKENKIHVLTSKFETVLINAGYKKYFEEIKKQGIRSKPIIGKYVATKIVENKLTIPQQFVDILNQLP